MRKLKVSKLWISAFLAFMLAVLLTGCGDPDKNPAGAPADPLTPPTVTFVTPPDASTLVCPNSPVVTATFSKAMNPATINTSTFTLAAGGVSVAGQVAYNAATDVASFTPTASLAPSTTFTATITTSAADTFGNTLASNFVWTFTTSATCPAPPPPVSGLGTACSFGILGGSTVTNVVGTATTVSGDVGVWPGSAVTGFGPPASITGTIFAGDATAQAAQGDLTRHITTLREQPEAPFFPQISEGALSSRVFIRLRALNPRWESPAILRSMVKGIPTLLGSSRLSPRWIPQPVIAKCF